MLQDVVEDRRDVHIVVNEMVFGLPGSSISNHFLAAGVASNSHLIAELTRADRYNKCNRSKSNCISKCLS